MFYDSEEYVYTVCSALELSLSRFENGAVHCVLCTRAEYTALLGSRALRTKNIYRVLRFGACIALSMFVSRAINGSYEFDRIVYHWYVNIYAVHQLYDS